MDAKNPQFCEMHTTNTYSGKKREAGVWVETKYYKQGRWNQLLEVVG